MTVIVIIRNIIMIKSIERDRQENSRLCLLRRLLLYSIQKMSTGVSTPYVNFKFSWFSIFSLYLALFPESLVSYYDNIFVIFLPSGSGLVIIIIFLMLTMTVKNILIWLKIHCLWSALSYYLSQQCFYPPVCINRYKICFIVQCVTLNSMSDKMIFNEFDVFAFVSLHQ